MKTESLKQFKSGSTSPKTTPWRAPRASDFDYGYILAFDQSLSACGAVALSSSEEGLVIEAAHKFPAFEVNETGNEASFLKAVLLTHAITDWRLAEGFTAVRWAFVHEAPPVGGGRIREPESALLSGMSVRLSLNQFRCEGMVTPAQHKKFICGNAKADKKEQHAALAELAITLPIINYHLITNEAKRDALCIALHYLGTNNGSGSTP